MQKIRAKARTGKVATPMCKIKTGDAWPPMWADQPGNWELSNSGICAGRRESDGVWNPFDCACSSQWNCWVRTLNWASFWRERMFNSTVLTTVWYLSVFIFLFGLQVLLWYSFVTWFYLTNEDRLRYTVTDSAGKWYHHTQISRLLFQCFTPLGQTGLVWVGEARGSRKNKSSSWAFGV